MNTAATEPRDVALVTVARSDWGIYRSVVEALAASPLVRLRVLASGMHLSKTHGETVRIVEEEAAALGVPVERVAMPLSSDAPVAVAQAMGHGLAAFGRSFAAQRPDILLVLGDRYEMFCAVAAAVPFVLPVFHIHGGERTAGAIDDALRHAMTKLSHLHLVSTREYGRRVRQLGEDAWRIVVCGAPALDALSSMAELDPVALSDRLGFSLARPYVLAAFHPTTLEPGEAHAQGLTLVSALVQIGLPVLFMMPNADPGGGAIRTLVQQSCSTRDDWTWVENLRFEEYATVLRHATVMIGNSSSGIIEAPTYQVPVVNIGRRQEGRVRGANVIDVDQDPSAIAAAAARTLDSGWRGASLARENPYFAGGAAPRILDVVSSMPLDLRLTNKGFVDVPAPCIRRREDFCVALESPIRSAMECIDRNRTGIAIVVDAEWGLVAALTDGDIRRAILGGVSIEADVASIVPRGRRSPVALGLGATRDDMLTTMRDAQVRQLPIVTDGKVVDLVLLDDLIGGGTA